MKNETDIEVSVVCITYNHEKYIRKALDSILSQKASFPFEVIIHDDVSTDGTAEILGEYEKKYPRLSVVYEKTNQYSKGIDFFAPIVRGRARGKYIATCEGDDFWTDDTKLQRQWEALERHPECDMCACCGVTVTEDGIREVSMISPKERDGILTPEEVILGGAQYLVTAGLFFRKSMYDSMLAFEKIVGLDYSQQIKGALRGGIYYIARKMAVYRRYSQGSWTMQVLKNRERLDRQWELERNILNTLDKDTDGKYHAVIQERLKAYQTFPEQLEKNRESILSRLAAASGLRYLWGMGRRGNGFEEFCHKEEIRLDGVCDATNERIGGQTEYGNLIVSTDEVVERADVILASSQIIFDDLRKLGLANVVINLQPFMPYG